MAGFIDDDGYRLIHLPDHPRAHQNHYVYEHIVVMEKHLGRPLESNEVVHHINENRSDNRIENLMLFKNNGDHTKYHWKMGSYRNSRKPRISEEKRRKIIEMIESGCSYSEVVRAVGVSYNIVKKYALRAGTKSRYSRVDDNQKQIIRKLLDENKTYRYIAKEVEIGIGTITKLIKRGEL